MNRAALLLIASVIPLAACNVSKNDRSDGNVSMNADGSGNVSFNVPFVNGNVKLPQGAVQAGNFDIDGVKIPDGTIHDFSMNAGDKGATVHLAFNAPKSPDEVRAYLLNQLKQKGDEVSQSGNAISGKTKDGDTFVINVDPAAQGSQGTVTVQSKD